ncbi:MAG: hypothetical protein GY858_07765 [Candidatus Omnitrophica bacterium]|nr:hypothetical protein [Candidatus Omnitrophota bacterium]
MVKKNINLSSLTDEQLLELKICDLSLNINGTWLAECVDELYRELEQKNINFRPPCYLADEWLTPDKEPLVGVPFFLADPALIRLEKKMMLEAEGSNKPWCMKLLRHEAGHAINYAYRFYRRKKWKEVFGSFNEEYAETYRFRPYSKSFVRHLENYYAQYHPDEDFSETFAVWLTPDSDWSTAYKDWKALGKLNYVDELMREIAGRDAPVKKGKKYWHVSAIRTTLKSFYKKKQRDSAEEFPHFHDANLKEIFCEKAEADSIAAAVIIRRYRKDILENVSTWTGEKKYVIGTLLKKITARCKELKLVAHESEAITMLKVSTYITTLVMNYLHTGWFGGGK